VVESCPIELSLARNYRPARQFGPESRNYTQEFNPPLPLTGLLFAAEPFGFSQKSRIAGP
jgi:hypothetical protein